MKQLLKKYSFLLDISFFITIFILSIKPLRDFDIWFHLKSGEIIAKLGIIHFDVFAYTTKGREWFPYEWLFQVTVYWVQQLFGLEAIRFFVSACILAQLVLIYFILKRYFKVPKIAILTLCFFFFVSNFEFFTARPHMLAYTLLLATLAIIFEYYFYNKWKPLLLIIPIILIWANMHGSIFLAPFFFFGYASVCVLRFFLKDGKSYLTKAKVLMLFGLLSGLLSILPPLWFTQYRLLWMFWLDRKFISMFIDEWTPLYINQFAFYFVSISIFVVGTFFIFALVKSRKYKDALWLLPLLPFFVLTYTASRNVYLLYFPLTFMLGISISWIWNKKKKFLLLAALAGSIFVIGHAWLLSQKMQELPLYYPAKATNFLKTYHINGHMFNEYGYGGYLLYQLYPEYKVFFDGRTDLYLTREMPDTLELTIRKYEKDPDYKKFLDSLWNKYDISFVLLRTEKHILTRKIFHILTNDPKWSLVFWDDYTEIFVRKDGKNDAIIKQFGVSAATPFERDPYKTGQEDKAFVEYQRMIDAGSDSSKSRNTLGYILLQKHHYDLAKSEFEKAISIDPNNESPYMNLGELAANDGQFDEAINLYKKAQNLAPDRGFIYIRLGQLFLQGYSDATSAKYIWTQGVKNTVDADAKKQLQKLLETL